MNGYRFNRSAEDAWHDAFASMQSSRNILEPRDRSALPNDYFQLYQTDLAKVKALIDQLPAHQRDVGMYLFGPDDSPELENSVSTFIWSHFINQRGPQFTESFQETSRCIILCRASLKEARYRVRGDKFYGQRELAGLLGMSQSTFSRGWKKIFETFLELLVNVGKDALTPVAILCGEINERYRSAA